MTKQSIQQHQFNVFEFTILLLCDIVPITLVLFIALKIWLSRPTVFVLFTVFTYIYAWLTVHHLQILCFFSNLITCQPISTQNTLHNLRHASTTYRTSQLVSTNGHARDNNERGKGARGCTCNLILLMMDQPVRNM